MLTACWDVVQSKGSDDLRLNERKWAYRVMVRVVRMLALTR